MAKIIEKLEQLDARLDRIDVNLAVYNSHLEAHMKRSDALEEYVHTLKASVDDLRSFRDKLVGGLKLLAAGSVISALIRYVNTLL